MNLEKGWNGLGNKYTLNAKLTESITYFKIITVMNIKKPNYFTPYSKTKRYSTEKEINHIVGPLEKCNKVLSKKKETHNVEILSSMKFNNSADYMVFVELSKKTPPIRWWPPVTNYY
ncbi:MAG: hypothetical protein AABY07_00090 [Nanoarchaeota archaeon]